MTTETLTCPYCNARIGISAGLTPGQKIICPRCGDAFPLRFVDSITSQPDAPRTSDTSITANAPPAPRTRAAADVALPTRRSNRLIAGAVIAVMLFMAGGGLTFMLMTQQQRRGYDTSRPPRRPGKQRGVPEADLPPVIASVSPDKLAALGYLPEGVNFLFAARVAELLASPAGIKLGRDRVQLGPGAHQLGDLPAWLGFRLEDIDHLVFAARIDEDLIPPFYVVFRTVGPYDEEQLRQRLKPTRVPSPSKKTLYAFHPSRPDIPLCAWCADARTVVIGLLANQLERLPGQPVEDLQQLPEEVRTVLKERREPAAPVWIAGHSRDWSKTSAMTFLGWMKKEDGAKLLAMNTFGLWFVPNNSLTVKGAFACKDEKGARDLEDYFRSLREPNGHFKTALDGPWLLLQFQTEPDFLSRWLKH
jgi:hypothetical protein